MTDKKKTTPAPKTTDKKAAVKPKELTAAQKEAAAIAKKMKEKADAEGCVFC